MNKKLVIRIVTDVLMTISLLLLMPYSLLSETAHEWIGIVNSFHISSCFKQKMDKVCSKR